MSMLVQRLLSFLFGIEIICLKPLTDCVSAATSAILGLQDASAVKCRGKPQQLTAEVFFGS